MLEPRAGDGLLLRPLRAVVGDGPGVGSPVPSALMSTKRSMPASCEAATRFCVPCVITRSKSSGRAFDDRDEMSRRACTLECAAEAAGSVRSPRASIDARALERRGALRAGAQARARPRPRARNACTIAVPTKPVPPVTRTFIAGSSASSGTGCRPALALVLRAERGAAVRRRRRLGELHERELADLHRRSRS